MNWHVRLLYIIPLFGFVWAIPEMASGNSFDAFVTIVLSIFGYETFKRLDKDD